MERIVDTRGLACPEPVILAKKALDGAKEVVVIVDNDEAVENIRRLANKMGCAIAVVRDTDGAFRIRLTRSGETPPYEGTDIGIVCGTAQEGKGAPLVIVLSSDRMGRGNDELGGVLMRSFVHTLLTLEPRPGTIILYNTGVRLAGRESAVIDDLKELEAAGVELFVCGTCVNYFDLKGTTRRRRRFQYVRHRLRDDRRGKTGHPMNEEISWEVILFLSVQHALRAEKLLKEAGIPCKLIPVPRHLSSDCGVCLRFEPHLRPRVEAALRDRVETGAILPL